MALGLDKRTSRTDGLRMKASGDEKEFSAWAQENLLNRGHEVEKYGVEHAQQIIGEELFPETATDDSGQYLASFDGITMSSTKAAEVKLWNEVLVDYVRRGELPDTHWPQIAGQFIVGDELEEIVFVVTDGTPERTVSLILTRDNDMQKKIATVRAGWDQFAADVASYQHVEYIPAPAGTSTMSNLPTLLVDAKGEVTQSNFAEFKVAALAMIGAIRTELVTDQDFADADDTVKKCAQAEADIPATKRRVLSGMVDVTTILDGLDEIDRALSKARIALEKRIKERKDARRAEIIAKAKSTYTAHIESLKAETGGPWIVLQPPDFAGAIKGLRTIASQQNAVDTALANGKIAADASAKLIRANLACMKDDGAGYEFLFRDSLALINKPIDDLRIIIKSRIDAHKAAEAAKEEATRTRIREEEAAKLAKAQADKEAAERAALQAAQVAPPPPATPAIAPVAAQPAPIPAPWGAQRKPRRPTDEEIIMAVARAFNVTTEDAIDWLAAMDFSDLAA